jgi:LPS export ABC transporter protein LptC
MNFRKTYLLLFPVLIIITLFSCESNFREVQKSNFSEFTPSTDADSINLKYTDSGKIQAVLVTPKMLEFAAVDFPFTEFPQGINLTIYDANGEKTYVTSNYAISYKETKIIDLQGNVKIRNDDGQLLETDQMFYDQMNEWFYTEKSYKFTDPKGNSTGQGIDFSKDFKIINSQRISGQVYQNP